MTRDPDAWAIYVRATYLDGREIMRSVLALVEMVDRRGGHVAGIYADVADEAGPEMGVLLGHAFNGAFGRLAVVDAGALGANLNRAAHVALALFDAGVRLYAYRFAGEDHPDGRALDLDQVGREAFGAIAGTSYGRTIDVITSTIGTAAGRHRPT